MSSRREDLARRAHDVLVGGVNSPVRAFAAVGGEPPLMERAQGCHIWDVDGRRWIDMTLAYGPHLLGHGHPAVVDALRQQVERGTAFGATTELEIALAERIRSAMPSMERVRFVNSGTEATMSALRLARGVTGRDRIVKFAGGYHGHADALLAEAGSGVATLGVPGSDGVPAAAVIDTIVIPFNDTDAIDAVFAVDGRNIAAVIVEPVAGNMGCVLPAPGWLAHLRRVTASHGALVIFDEVMTGFRVAHGGAQELFGVTPDITCLGKVIGAGLPVGAYGGRIDVMDHLAPNGPVYQAGTLSGNPLAMAAGCAALDQLSPEVYNHLEASGARLEAAINSAARDAGAEITVNRCGSMLTPFMNPHPVTDYASARLSDPVAFARIHRGLREDAVFWPPSQFEAAFLSTAHREEDLDAVGEAFARALAISGAAVPA